MFSVNTRQFDFCDWEAIEDFDFTCPTCDGVGDGVMVECEECEGVGYIDCGVCGGLGHLTDGEPCSECGGAEGWICQICNGEGVVMSDETCEMCNGDGVVVPIWNTAWDIDTYEVSDETRKEVTEQTNCTIFKDDDEGWWLGLTACGMDLTPDLCKAWIMLGLDWLPLEWISSIISTGRDYCGYVAGKDWVDKIYDAALETANAVERQASYIKSQLQGEKA